MKGYLQVYSGEGKGKTTAALGLIMRAVGAGLRVYLGQFLKKGSFSEIRTLASRFPDVVIEQYGAGGLIRGKPSRKDADAARNGLAALRKAMLSRKYDVIIADEANTAAALDLIELHDLLALIACRPEDVELVLTGRNAKTQIVRRADLVTEMKSVKHYYGRGIKGRRGIEF